MSESGLGALLNVRKTRPDVRKCSKVLPVCPVAIWRSSQMSGSGRKVLKDVREWSRGHPGCPGVVGRPARMSGSVVRMSGSVREALTYVW